MTIEEIGKALEAEVLCGENRLGLVITSACGSDLMSDVLAFTRPHWLLLTALANPHVVRTAEMADLAAVCFVRGKEPDQDTVSLAAEKGIPLLRTRLCMFDACVSLHAHGLAGCSDGPARRPRNVGAPSGPHVPSAGGGNE